MYTTNKFKKGEYRNEMCKSPLARCEKLGDTYINKQGNISHNCDFISWADVERNLKFYETKYKKVDMIPCGKCWECRLQKSRDKATQLMLEKMYYKEDECWFVTLTYADEYLPLHRTVDVETGELHEGFSLSKEDAQKFIKKLRRYYEYHYEIKNIRYCITGEYGNDELLPRPHLHAIIFGLPLDPTKLKLHKHNKFGHPLWEHEELTKIWGKGLVDVGRVTWEDCAYVARYVMKKQYGENAWYYGATGVIPEFINQSTKPALGKRYLEENIEKILLTDSVPIANKKTAQLVKPPKSFDRALKKLYPGEFEEIQRKRKKAAQQSQEIKNKYTTLTPQEQRERHAEIVAERIKKLPRKEM